MQLNLMLFWVTLSFVVGAIVLLLQPAIDFH